MATNRVPDGAHDEPEDGWGEEDERLTRDAAWAGGAGVEPDEPWGPFDEGWPERARKAGPPELAKMCPKIPALVQTWKRCGKPNCRCARGELHGPYWSLRWRDGAGHRRKHVRAGELDEVRAILAGRRRERAELRADLAEADRLLAALRAYSGDGATLAEVLAASPWDDAREAAAAWAGDGG